MTEALVKAERLTKIYSTGGSAGPVVRAIDDVSLELAQGASLGVVGETGSGKSTLGLLLLALTEPTRGEVFFDGQDIFRLSSRALRRLRRHMQIVFQDPDSTLNPRRSVGQTVVEPLLVQRLASGSDANGRAAAVLEKVGLGAQYLDRYPHQLSGGQKQRVAIARALITSPKFVVFDEPTSALDVSMQARILSLVRDVRAEMGLTYIFVSHDLSVVRHICEESAVMYLGQIVELARTEQLFADPLHPYTQVLISSVPEPDPRRRRIIDGAVRIKELPSRLNYPSGCRFHTRCPVVMERCKTVPPELRAVEGGRRVACHLYE